MAPKKKRMKRLRVEDDNDHKNKRIKKRNGLRESTNLEIIKDPKRRKITFNKRIEGLIKKISELYEITGCSSLYYIQNPDTKRMVFGSTNGMIIESIFMLIGSFLRLSLDNNAGKSFKDTLFNLIDLFEDKQNKKLFIECIVKFVEEKMEPQKICI